MAKSGGSRRASGGARVSGRTVQRQGSNGKGAAKGAQKKGAKSAQAKPAQRRPKNAAPVEPAVPAPGEPRVFRLGVVPGSTPGKWIDAWKVRMPDVPIEVVPMAFADQRSALANVDAAIVRLPFDATGVHVIPLYDELPVVVTSAESHLLAGEELTAADLVGEVLITPLDDVLGPLTLPGTVTPSFTALATTEEAIATVATGTGIVVVPMSLARAHQRKDAEYRILRDGPTSSVALAWPEERTTDDVDVFIGIVRGRTANSSR